MFTIPACLYLGFFSFGVLFPPQVREGVFRLLISKEGEIPDDGPSADILVTLKENNAVLKSEICNVKEEMKMEINNTKEQMKTLETKIDDLFNLCQERAAREVTDRMVGHC